MAYRSKSAARAFAELTQLHQKYPQYPISMVDNILDMHYFKAFLPEIRAQQLELDLFYEVKANLKKKQVRLLYEAGVRRIQPGIESFSDEVLALMDKGVTGLQMFNC